MRRTLRSLEKSLNLRGATAVLAPLAAVVVILTALAAISVVVMSDLRAYSSSESSWSKAQKEAVFSLRQFGLTGDEADFQKFRQEIGVPESDRLARLEMDKSDFDPAAVQKNFLAGRISQDDLPGMIWLYRNFKGTYLFGPAVSYWEQSDHNILRLQAIGESLHQLKQAGALHSPQANAETLELQALDAELTVIADGFSRAVSVASREIKILLLAVLSTSAVVLLAGAGLYVKRMFAVGDRLQAQLRRSEERLSLGFEGSNFGLWDWDLANQTLYFSPWINRQLGFIEEEFASSPESFFEFVHADDRDATKAAVKRHIKENAPYIVEYRIQTVSGEYRWVKTRGQATRDASGRAVRMVGTLIDITGRKTAEAEAFAEKELVEVTLASIADAVITTDAQGHITYCNKVATALLGLPAKALVGQHCDAAFRIFAENGEQSAPDLSKPVAWPECANEEKRNLYLFHANGEPIPIDKSIAAIHNSEGEATGFVIVLHDVSEVRRHAAQLSYQATHDELTGVLNRREFERRLKDLLADTRHERHSPRHAIMYLDLDRFKIINDTCGHAAGDEMIRQVAQSLKNRLREGDLLGRLGGDEFGIVLPRCSSMDALRIADILREAVTNARFSWGQRSFAVGVSIGVVISGDKMNTIKEVLSAADAACYMAKEKGRNRVHVFRHDDAEISVRHSEMEWVSHIKLALEQDRFCLYTQAIQPLSPVSGNRGGHVEVLLRMLDEDGNIISPASFIPAAERYDLMPQIDRWVIRHSFQALASLGSTTGKPHWSINLSGASIGDDNLLDYIIAEQKKSGISFDTLCFEITETAAIANLQKAVAFINRLRRLGCRFALDDFGVGMSSFSYLKNPAGGLHQDRRQLHPRNRRQRHRLRHRRVDQPDRACHGQAHHRRVRRKRSHHRAPASHRRRLRARLRHRQAERICPQRSQAWLRTQNKNLGKKSG